MENKANKDAYYFSHDSNARNDEKILLLRMKLGMEGYGIFWAILEKMRENADYMCSKNYGVIAFDLGVDEDKIKRIVEEFGLFKDSECGKRFYSESLMNRMAKMNEKSQKAKDAANARWNKPSKKKDNANAMRTHSEGNAIKERKRKENKGKEIKELIIDNSAFAKSCKDDTQWSETTAMKFNVSRDVINVFMDQFEQHLITTKEQKQNEKKFAEHFNNWLPKQTHLSMHQNKPVGRSNQRQ